MHAMRVRVPASDGDSEPASTYEMPPIWIRFGRYVGSPCALIGPGLPVQVVTACAVTAAGGGTFGARVGTTAGGCSCGVGWAVTSMTTVDTYCPTTCPS